MAQFFFEYSKDKTNRYYIIFHIFIYLKKQQFFSVTEILKIDFWLAKSGKYLTVRSLPQ